MNTGTLLDHIKLPELPDRAARREFWADKDDTLAGKLLVIVLAGSGLALHGVVWLYQLALYALLIGVPIAILYKLVT